MNFFIINSNTELSQIVIVNQKIWMPELDRFNDTDVIPVHEKYTKQPANIWNYGFYFM